MAPRRTTPRRPRRARYPDLATFLDETGTTQTAFARRVHVSQAYVSRVAAGTMVPGWKYRRRIADAANIPEASFERNFQLVMRHRRRVA